MFMSITVEQALQLLMEHTPILEEEEAALPKSLGRILTHRVYARYSQPPFDRSPLDGYALRAADAAAAAVAAGAGVSALTVRRRAKIAVISTGSELQQPGKPLEPGKIYNSNAAFLTANLQQMGVEWTESLPVEDDTECIARALSSLADGADMILTTGGVSVGQKDLMEAAVLRAGGSIVFHGIAMKPGMPAMFAVLGHKMLLCLSGNPFSAAAPFFLFVKPVLAA